MEGLISSLTIELEDGKIEAIEVPVYQIETQSLTPKLVDVTNRLVTYTVPKMHLGTKLHTSDAYDLGVLVIAFLKLKLGEAKGILEEK